jgi:hypothetical protein
MMALVAGAWIRAPIAIDHLALALEAPFVDEVEASVFEGVVGGEGDADEGQDALIFCTLACWSEDPMGWVRLGHRVEGRIAVVAVAEELDGVFPFVAVGASSPEDAVGRAEHGASSWLEEDVG